MIRRRAAPLLAAWLGLALAGAGACTSEASAPPTTPDTATSAPSVRSTGRPPSSGPAATAPADAAGRHRLVGFDEARLQVTTADGQQVSPCVLLATTPAQRSRGLMEVEDRTLGGYDGMLFVFDADTTGGFWMKDTVQPLSIAFLGQDGTVVSTADMDPCPRGSDDCPSTRPAGPYRTALEVPQGRLPDVGVADGSTVVVVDDHC